MSDCNNNLKKWISVKDFLPPHGKRVLCWSEWIHEGEKYSGFQIGYLVNSITPFWGGDPMNSKVGKVLYWMRLPEPPETDRVEILEGDMNND